jgi:hypothetical protein
MWSRGNDAFTSFTQQFFGGELQETWGFLGILGNFTTDGDHYRIYHGIPAND